MMKYSPVEILNVFWEKDAHIRIPVGRLAYIKRQAVFEYTTEFLRLNIALSPFHLPQRQGVIPAERELFDSLHGVFNDSLPDGWGRLLLDRQLQRLNINPVQLTPLDRLAYVGHRGLGALSYEPNYGGNDNPNDPLDLEQLAAATRINLQGAPEKIISELLSLAGSSAGARPKIVVGVSADKKDIVHDPQQLAPGHEHWLIKFPSAHDLGDIAAIEYAYSCMAKDAGIEMATTHLFSTANGNRYFGTKRFDRSGDQRLHMHTACGLLNADFRLPSLDYKTLLAATFQLTKDIREVEKMYALAIFNVLAHNRDDHSKNFSFLMDNRGKWAMAPAYDLTFSTGPQGEHSTMMMGEGKNPGSEQFKALAESALLNGPKALQIVERTQAITSQWSRYANDAGVSKESMKFIKQYIT